jgi:hypothetical protein
MNSNVTKVIETRKRKLTNETLTLNKPSDHAKDNESLLLEDDDLEHQNQVLESESFTNNSRKSLRLSQKVVSQSSSSNTRLNSNTQLSSSSKSEVNSESKNNQSDPVENTELLSCKINEPNVDLNQLNKNIELLNKKMDQQADLFRKVI